MISVVIPVFNEEGNIVPLYNKLIQVLDNYRNYEILFVDDGSSDNTFRRIADLHKGNKRVRAVRLKRNFGKAAALSEGFAYAKGDIIVTMDGDLQDEPKEIPLLLEKMKEGYDLVNGWKETKHAGSLRKMSSRIYNNLARIVSGVDVHDFNCPFKAYRKETAKSLRLYGEMHRYIPALVKFIGYSIGEVAVSNYPRMHGKTKYGSKRLIKGLLDLITIKYIMSYKSRPAHIFGGIGLLLGGIGFIMSFFMTIEWLLGVPLAGRPLLMLADLLMVVGVQFVSIGLLGEMLAYRFEREDKEDKVKEVL
ncbi:glycosyltransferase family 2 protein [archaeon]|nr:glycosyltransferase family 2 protein [archaeon]